MKVGKASVVVTAMGDKCTGTVTKTFKIVPKQAVVASAAAGKKQMTVKAKTAVSKTGGATYQTGTKSKGPLHGKRPHPRNRVKLSRA